MFAVSRPIASSSLYSSRLLGSTLSSPRLQSGASRDTTQSEVDMNKNRLTLEAKADGSEPSTKGRLNQSGDIRIALSLGRGCWFLGGGETRIRGRDLFQSVGRFIKPGITLLKQLRSLSKITRCPSISLQGAVLAPILLVVLAPIKLDLPLFNDRSSYIVFEERILIGRRIPGQDKALIVVNRCGSAPLY